MADFLTASLRMQLLAFPAIFMLSLFAKRDRNAAEGRLLLP